MSDAKQRFQAAEDIIYDIIAPAVGDIIRTYAPPTASNGWEEYDDQYTWALNQMRDLAYYMEKERRQGVSHDSQA